MNTNTSIAEGKVRLAIDRIASKYPLHAGILSRWRVVEDCSVSTMGVGYADGKLRLLFSPDFVNRVTLDELGGVLIHEAHHVLFDHVFHKPEADEDGAARTIAEELCCNEWIEEPLPSGVIKLCDYPYLPANEDTDARYGRLAKRSKKRSAGNTAGSSYKQGKSRGSTNGIPTVDDHSTWEEISKNAKTAKAAASVDIGIVWNDLGEDEREKVTGPAADAAEEATERSGLDVGRGYGQGNTPGEDAMTLEKGASRVPWQTVLRRKVNSVIERRPVFGRVPRRFPTLVGIIPGKGRIAGKPAVLAVVDTSGSMSTGMLSDISAELAVMARHVNITVVECDSEVHAIYAYRPITKVHGGGGTDLRPAFAPELLKKYKPSLVVVFTDGVAAVPTDRPPVPVIWCLTAGGRKPTEWGEEIHIMDQELPVGSRFLDLSTKTPRFSTKMGKLGARLPGAGLTSEREQ